MNISWGDIAFDYRTICCGSLLDQGANSEAFLECINVQAGKCYGSNFTDICPEGGFGNRKLLN